jgi:transcriptional regulator with XRE-family HTH domain
MAADLSVAPRDLPPLATLVRSARHVGDLSQRELAAASGVSARTVAALESGERQSAGWDTAVRLLAATGCRVLVVGPDGRPVDPLAWEAEVDRGGRHWPAHLDVQRVRSWQRIRPRDRHVGPMPTHTYEVDRERRDACRRLQATAPPPALMPVEMEVPVVEERERLVAVLDGKQRAALGPGIRVPVRVAFRGAESTAVLRGWRGGWSFPVDGRLRRAGMAVGTARRVRVERDVADVSVPTDLQAALARWTRGRARFDALPATHRRQLVEWLEDARLPDTRHHRVGVVADLARRRGRRYAAARRSVLDPRRPRLPGGAGRGVSPPTPARRR